MLNKNYRPISSSTFKKFDNILLRNAGWELVISKLLLNAHPRFLPFRHTVCYWPIRNLTSPFSLYYFCWKALWSTLTITPIFDNLVVSQCLPNLVSRYMESCFISLFSWFFYLVQNYGLWNMTFIVTAFPQATFFVKLSCVFPKKNIE